MSANEDATSKQPSVEAEETAERPNNEAPSGSQTVSQTVLAGPDGFVIQLGPPDPASGLSHLAVIKKNSAPYYVRADVNHPKFEAIIEAHRPENISTESHTYVFVQQEPSLQPQSSKDAKKPESINGQEVSDDFNNDDNYEGIKGDDEKKDLEGSNQGDGLPELVPEMVYVRPMNRMVHITRDPGAAEAAFLRDPEKDAPVAPPEYAPGYPSTAAIMSTDPELSVYRRFDRLNARSFLYYQAQLMYLESELDKMDEEDRLCKNSEETYHLKHFKELWEGSSERVLERRRVVEEIRWLLKDYNEALFYYKEMINAPEPSQRVVTSIRNWKANQGDPPVVDISEQAYDPRYEADLLALKPPKCDDPLSIWVQNNMGKFFKKPQPATIPNSSNVLYYSETAIDLFVTIICTILAIVVLVGSMTTLYFVESQGVRLGLVWVFTFLFAVSIFLMANLTKGEIFLATAAYCAILVVYISGG
ncbi:hypothetical protein ABW19_dt0202377 [Dactylella cylindrospora]|nr:hypothetical protein ABW19_dt0202377 [Dactylella cylindrospora]